MLSVYGAAASSALRSENMTTTTTPTTTTTTKMQDTSGAYKEFAEKLRWQESPFVD